MRNSIAVTVALMILSFSGSVFGEEARVSSPPEPWNEKIKGDVDEAVRLSAADPVSALLTFKSVMDLKENGPTQRQKAWLSAKIESLQTQALKTLQTDFDQAARGYDLRVAVIASIVADKIGKESIKIQPAMTELKNKVFAGSPDATYVWAVSNVVGRFIEVPYIEQVYRVTMTPKEGFRLLRVTASVRNTSQLADKSYALWATEDIKRAIAPIFAKPEEHKVAYLWLDDSFVWLLTPSSDLVPCSHACGIRSGGVALTSPDGTARVIAPPQIIDAGKKMDIDLIFSVPKGITDYRLLVFGSAPTKLKIIPVGEAIKEKK